MKRSTVQVLGGVAAGLAAIAAVGIAKSREKRRLAASMRGQVAVVGGASRGLGRAIARELGHRGARVAICARTPEHLEACRRELVDAGVTVLAQACDLRSEGQTRAFFERVERELGPIDVVVANAATITVAPIETLQPDDFDRAMREIFGVTVRATLAALPSMQARRTGTIALIASIGGKVGVPHLAPYTAAKFATIGFAETLRAEVAKDGVHVLSVVPGLMRTGSHLHATFRGDPEKELAWFGAGATTPGVSIDADRAARQIADAIAARTDEITLTPGARLATWLHARFPHAWSVLTGLAARALPEAPAVYDEKNGDEVLEQTDSKVLHVLEARSAALAARFGQ